MAPTSKTPAAAPPVDMRAHNGLRGAAAMWIAIFHSVIQTRYPLDFQGSSLMPLFMMLAGFSITVTYGATRWRRPRLPCCGRAASQAAAVAAADVGGSSGSGGPPQEQQQQEDVGSESTKKTFPAASFWRNRFARVMPVYLLGLLLAAPTWPLGFGSSPYEPKAFVAYLIQSVLPVNAMTVVPNILGPGWFISLLTFFWLAFPFILPYVQRMTDDSLVRWISRCFHFQWVVLLSLFWNMFPRTGYWPAFLVATMHPASRFPLFLMGIYAGELANRYPVSASSEEGHNTTTSNDDDDDAVMPWPRSFLGFLPLEPPRGGSGGTCGKKPSTAAVAATETQHDAPALESGPSGAGRSLPPPPPSCCGPLAQSPPRTRSAWSRMATTQSLGLFLVTLLVCAAQVFLSFTNEATLYGGVFLQALVPMAQLNVLVALTRDGGGASLASKALRTPLAQWLGKLSMNIYLLHYPLLAYLAFIVNGGRPNRYTCGPDEAKDECWARFEQGKTMPLWGIAVVPAAALLLSELVHRVVEAPARRCLRKEG